LILLFVPGKDEAAHGFIRWTSLAFTLVTFALSLWLWAQFDASNPGFQFVENFDVIGTSIGYRMGVDGISILFIPLTALLMIAVVISSWGPVKTRVKEYFIVFLVLETLMLGVFATLDLAMFYVFFE